jgi:penicillin-binding protein 2
MLGTYPPGSTIKPFMAAAALQYNTLNPSSPVYCSGALTLPGSEHKYRCWKRHGHGPVDLSTAIQKSCDVYFYQAAMTLGIDRIDEMLAQFGFGHNTQIDVPGERSGLLPTREWKRRVYKQAWFPGETLNMGIGQGYLTATPLQLAQAAARMAMRGAGFKPHVVHAITDVASGTTTEVAPEPLPAMTNQSAALAERVISAMQLVTMSQGGTAYAAFKGAAYTSAGKTGTAQVAGLKQDEENAPKLAAVPLKLRDHALFIAFAPVEAPRIAVAVIAEHAGHGGSVSAPVARQVIDQYLLGKVTYGTANVPVTPPKPVPSAEPADDAVDAVPPDAGPGTPVEPTNEAVPQ